MHNLDVQFFSILPNTTKIDIIHYNIIENPNCVAKNITKSKQNKNIKLRMKRYKLILSSIEVILLQLLSSVSAAQWMQGFPADGETRMKFLTS